jgi:cytochrome c556
MTARRPSGRVVAGIAATLLFLSGCGGEHSAAPKPRYGALMSEMGRRFETMGRAALAHRWELAAFELHEMEEVFEDLANAPPPRESRDVDLAGIREAFLNTNPPELRSALASRDLAAFAEAFERAAATCNGCHKASGHAFIEIPLKPGASVPVLDPVP